ncbi:hypothetical protein [Fodinibius salsisoli]|uniref:Protocatechuate 3,4-dioxygenase beta subunit n=1 Tax=Fodinibius salsisoli TaxID=2820877 RepID=A0ABT3PLA0_9BACT|nr:hypothetical protein [Fodinibius salsisoli]MCW9705984.1 hypothetical protein [Fodinibius salsisoli]
MYTLRTILPLLLVLLHSHFGLAQEKSIQNAELVGGPCEGCEAVLDFGNGELSATDTLPGFEENKPKLKITGTIYKNDGETPAEGVILFIHHTNREGIYPTRGDAKGWERGYGYIHGWIKTGTDGRYTFYTFKPGSYSQNPAHIHPIILEPNGKYYWLSSYLFDDDPLLSDEERNNKSPRGGSNGILSLKKESGIWVGRRDYTLGKNIPNYE